MTRPDIKALEQQAAEAIESGDPADAKRFREGTGMPPADFQSLLKAHGPDQLASAVRTHLGIPDPSQGVVTDFKVHNMVGMSPGDAYDQTQTDGAIKDGDVLDLGGGNVAVLTKAWPMVVAGEIDGFHTLIEGVSFDDFEGGRYAMSAAKAREVASQVAAVNPTVPGRMLVVDGINEEGNFAGDGELAPFVVFDAGQQVNIAGPFTTRQLAEQHRVEILSGQAPRLDRRALVNMLEAGTAEPDKNQRTVSLSGTTVTFTLPDDFGQGWDYTNVSLYGASHAWAGSYNKSEGENFAHEVLLQMPEIESSYLAVGLDCNVKCTIADLSEAAAIQTRLQAVVDAFSVRPAREISIRGSNFYDGKVTEYDANDPEIEVVSDMPYLNYLAKYVPLAETLPALSGHDLDALRAEADAHQRAKAANKDDSPSPGM